MRRPVPAGRARIVALLAAIVALAPATAAIAEPATAALGDPLESAECQRAFAVLNSEEAAVAESARASGGVTTNDRRLIDAKLAPLRRQAARACLARRADPVTLSSSARLVRPPPLTTQPLAVAPASSPAPTAATARAAPLAPLPLPAEKPYAITSCDPGGCWANDGSRLSRVGPNLWGPRGICTVQGSLLQCP